MTTAATKHNFIHRVTRIWVEKLLPLGKECSKLLHPKIQHRIDGQLLHVLCSTKAVT